MQGESLASTGVSELGIDGDRGWGIVDVETGRVLTARREPKLLFGAARLDGEGRVVGIELENGSVLADDRALSDWLGKPVELREVDATTRGRFEIALADVGNEDDEGVPWFEWKGPRGSFHDRTTISFVSTGSLREWDSRRFRANVVVEGGDRDDDRLIGSKVAIGTASFEVTMPIDRCVIVTRPQPGGIERDLSVLRTINAERARVLAVGATVIGDGRIAVGDEVQLV